jgi:hypothetical protein
VKCWISQKIGSEKDSFDTRFKHVFFLCIWMGCRFAWRALRACLFFVRLLHREEIFGAVTNIIYTTFSAS